MKFKTPFAQCRNNCLKQLSYGFDGVIALFDFIVDLAKLIIGYENSSKTSVQGTTTGDTDVPMNRPFHKVRDNNNPCRDYFGPQRTDNKSMNATSIYTYIYPTHNFPYGTTGAYIPACYPAKAPDEKEELKTKIQTLSGALLQKDTINAQEKADYLSKQAKLAQKIAFYKDRNIKLEELLEKMAQALKSKNEDPTKYSKLLEECNQALIEEEEKED